jgi:hypothetical protein
MGQVSESSDTNSIRLFGTFVEIFNEFEIIHEHSESVLMFFTLISLLVFFLPVLESFLDVGGNN